MQCAAPQVGSWTQTRTYSAAAYPTCWTAGAWSPATAPAGTCVAIPPPPVAVVAPWWRAENMAPVFGISGSNTRGTTVLGFVPVGKACTGPVVYSYRSQGYRRVASADVVWWASTPTTAAAVACNSTLAEHRRQSDRAYLLGVLDAAGWSVAKAARLAGVNRTHFYELARSCGISLGATKGNPQWRALQ